MLGDLEKTCQSKGDSVNNRFLGANSDGTSRETSPEEDLNEMLQGLSHHDNDDKNNEHVMMHPAASPNSKWKYQGQGLWESKRKQQQQPTTSTPVKPATPVNKPASSATKELDDLMSSLDSFKMQANSPVNNEESGVISKGESGLDDMLGDLQENMDKQGVKITPKGQCIRDLKISKIGESQIFRLWRLELKI